MRIRNFVDHLREPNRSDILYLQSQDGNIYRTDPRMGGEELKGMRRYIQRDISWMVEATGRSNLQQRRGLLYSSPADEAGEHADAVNLWIGSERSSTSLHHDPSVTNATVPIRPGLM